MAVIVCVVVRSVIPCCCFGGGWTCRGGPGGERELRQVAVLVTALPSGALCGSGGGRRFTSCLVLMNCW